MKRNEFLLGMEGWYNTIPSLPLTWKLLYEEYENSYSRLKFSRWLSQNNKCTQTELSELGESLSSTANFKISCRYNDFIRVSQSPHYKSCFRDYKKGFGIQLRMYIEDPNVAIVYIPDSAGHFLTRFFIRSVVNSTDEKGILVYTSYGKPFLGIFSVLSQISPLYEGSIYKSTTVMNLTKVKIPHFYEDVVTDKKGNYFVQRMDISEFSIK